MYLPGQVIYDLDRNKPVIIGDVWDINEYPKHNIHLICADAIIRAYEER